VLAFRARRHDAGGRIVRFVGAVDPAPVALHLREPKSVLIDGTGLGPPKREQHLLTGLLVLCGAIVALMLLVWRFWRA